MSVGWLIERLRDEPAAPALIWRDQPVPYAALAERFDRWQGELDRLGIGPGRVVGLEGDFSPGAIALLLALIARQAIVVPLTRFAAAHRAEFLAIAEVQDTITFDEQDAWQHTRCTDTAVRHPLLRQLLDSRRAGLVLFSSGSTGKSKAALHDFERLLERFQTKRQRWCTITFLLLDHIGGINTLCFTLANGGTVVALRERDPAEVCRAIAAHRVELLPASPSFLNLLLLSEAYRHHDLSSLKRITYGTEVMPESTLQRLHAILPAVTLQQTYGLSELGILQSKSRDSNSLWVKVGGDGFETKIVDGILWIRARTAMLGYLNAPSPFDADGWMNTQDEVEVDGEYVRILGRRSEIINVGGQKVYPAEVENVLMQMPNILDATVCGERNPIMGNIVTARVNLRAPEDLAALKQRLRTFCKDKLPSFKIPVRIQIQQESQVGARLKKIRPHGDAAGGPDGTERRQPQENQP